MRFVYPARIRRTGPEEVVVSFRDLPECLTSGVDEAEALAAAADALDVAIAGRIVYPLANGDLIPSPSVRLAGEHDVAVPADTAAKAALVSSTLSCGGRDHHRHQSDRDFCDAEPHAVEVFRRAHVIHIPIVVVAELRAGFVMGSRSAGNESVLTRFLTRPRVRVLLPDLTTSHHYARLLRQLRAAGTPIPTNDLWIAALAAQHDIPLFTRDQHFDNLPQLPRVD